MSQLVDRLVSDRLVMAVIVLNATALVLHEMAAPATPSKELWFWIDYACVIFFLLAQTTASSETARSGSDGVAQIVLPVFNSKQFRPPRFSQ